MSITLTDGQQAAYEGFSSFIINPAPGPFVIEGHSGTGKSTLVQTLLDRLPAILKTAKLINPKGYIEREVILTATTNQAADTFAKITGHSVKTIHSVLGLRVQKNYGTGKTKLVPRSGVDFVHDALLFVDEASYMDSNLMRLLFERTINCKIVLIGDPSQLLNVGSTRAPAFTAGFPTVKLTEVMRQVKGNPIVDLSTKFRNTVKTGNFFSFTPDGNHVQNMDRDVFEQAIVNEFNDPDWHHYRSKVLAWTNKTVINYNKAIRSHVKGQPEIHVSDFVVCNHFIHNGDQSLKTDQLVRVTNIENRGDNNGVPGAWYALDGRSPVFMPDDWAVAKQRLKQARKDEKWKLVREIEDSWADLRAAYACTINKSQGSTYDRVFIDLDDIKKCNSNDQVARMLYVAVSRARETVYLTGDLA